MSELRVPKAGRVGLCILALLLTVASSAALVRRGKAPSRAGGGAGVASGAEMLGPGEQVASPAGTGAPTTGTEPGKQERRGAGAGAATLRPGGGPQAPVSGSYQGEVGVTKDTITIGFIYARSGAYGALTRNVEPAIRAAFSEVNATGGIYGRKLVPIFGDDGYNNPSLALASAKDLVSKAFGVGTIVFNAFAAIHEFLESNRVPYLFVNADRAAALRLRYAFPITTFLQTQAELLPRFMVAKFNAQSKRVGIIFQDTPDLKPAIASFKEKASEAGLNIVVTQQVSETPTTCLNEVSRLQTAGAQVVWIATAPLAAVCILRDADTIGYRPIWTGTGNSFNFEVTNTASGCKTEGIITMSSWRTLESPNGQRYQAAMRKYYPNNPDALDDDVAVLGWGLANVWAEAMRRAGPAPTRESFVAGMESLRGWDGGQFAPLTFGPGNRMGSRAVLTIQVRNCRWVTIDSVWRDRF